ncbi:MAG: SDR family NAD(P)-dependent oxidoreductase [Kiritimatiellae bacterium]|nr:SDR family NAD(P)-dependent oxidoreductase [Kiritimatiellia bacterium]
MNYSYCNGQVAVVTGAGGTLCSAIAIDLAKKGAKVVLVGRTREKLEKVAGEITASGGICRIEPADVTDEAAMRDMAGRIAAEWGPCRFLINGAGGNNVKAMPTRLRFSEADYAPTADFAKDRGFFDIDMAAFKSVLEINTLGTVIPSRIFALQMAKAGGGAILNFASMNTYRPLTRVAPYAMSKAAIANWTMFFAQYMAPAKVRVNAVAPGFMVNERSRTYLMTPDGGLSPRGEQVMHHTPAGRFGEAEDLLGCVNWLLDDSVSSFVTGITVPVDGGFLSSAGV